MSAAFTRFRLPDEGNRGSTVYPSRLFFGRYVPFRSVVIPGLEVFWLVVSSLAVFALNSEVVDASSPVQWGQAGTLVVIYLVALFLMDLYNLDQLERRDELMTSLVEAMGLVCVAISATQYAFGFLRISPWLALLQVALTAALTLFARTVIGPRLASQRSSLHLGFIGGRRIRAEIEKEEQSLARLGFVLEPIAENVPQAARWFRPRIRECGLRHLVIDDACFGKRESYPFIEECVSGGIEIISLSAFCERALGKVALGPHLIADLRVDGRNPSSIAGSRLRRWRDVLGSCLGLVLALPVGILLAIAIKCDSPGPVLFTQERIGKNGRRFRMIKFRSMYHEMKATSGPAWTTREHDPRITRVGAVMRLFHLDELPQLVNVLRGEMSLVGPRPFHPEHCAEFETSPFFRLRLLVPPGITGWAQIRCSYADSVDDHREVLARDLFYVKHGGFLFDLFVLLDTFRICLWQKGSR